LEDGTGPDVAVGRYSFDHGELRYHQPYPINTGDGYVPEAVAIAVVVASEKVFPARFVLENRERLVDVG